MKKVKIPKFFAQPGPPAPTGPIFSGRRPKFKIPLPTFCSPCHPDSKKLWHNPTTWKPREEIDLAETPFFGVRAWPRGPRGPCHPPKNYLRWVGMPQKISAHSVGRFKSYDNFLRGHTDRQTHRQTDKKFWNSGFCYKRDPPWNQNTRTIYYWHFLIRWTPGALGTQIGCTRTPSDPYRKFFLIFSVILNWTLQIYYLSLREARFARFTREG